MSRSPAALPDDGNADTSNTNNANDHGVGGVERVYTAERPRLVGLAYRITGSRVDAEDIVQEAWLRAERVEDWTAVERPGAWFNTVVSRLALDHLKSARHRRETYVGPWLPEPVIAAADPAAEVELAESLTLGFLHLLEALAPVERVVFLLADVFDVPYREIGQVVERSPEACRQIASRARRHLRDGPDADATMHRHDGHGAALQVAQELFLAMSEGKLDDVVALMAEDVVLVSDGGAERYAARRPVRTPGRVGRFLTNLALRVPREEPTEVVFAFINGEPGVVCRRRDHPYLAVAVHVAEARVQAVHVVRNPTKLAALEITTPLV